MILSRHSNRLRGGTSLVEVMVVIILMGVVLGSIAVTLHRVYRIDTDVRAELEQMMTLSQMSAQFREDAHAAASAGFPAENNVVFELGGDQTIEYQFADGSIHRTKRRGNEMLHHDSYSLPDGAESSWRAIDTVQRPSVALTVRYPVNPAVDVHRQMRFDAVVGMLRPRTAQETAESE